MVTSMVRQEIEQRDREFEAAFNRGDTNAVAALYTEDATLMPPDAGIISGRPSIAEFWSGARASGIRSVSLQIHDVQAAGDSAYEIGTATLNIQPPDGVASTATVKYVVVWKRLAAGWHLAVDIWNNMAPA
jgi:uncharacterized protein (TIGR02246 family)